MARTGSAKQERDERPISQPFRGGSVRGPQSRNRPERGDLALDKQSFFTDDVTVLLSLVGDVEGITFYGLSEATALELASRMLGEALIELGGPAQSGIAELGNVITRRASIKPAEAGCQATISPPSLLLGRGATILTLDFGRVVVPLRSRSGTLLIHPALREREQDRQCRRPGGACAAGGGRSVKRRSSARVKPLCIHTFAYRI